MRNRLLAVVVALRGADRCVDVATRGLVALEGYGCQMVELDEDDRAVNTVVVARFDLCPTHPREVGLAEMAAILRKPDMVVARPQSADTGIQKPIRHLRLTP
jgi:hypothetical protein